MHLTHRPLHCGPMNPIPILGSIFFCHPSVPDVMSDLLPLPGMMQTILMGGVCSTVMDSLSLQMAQAAMAHAKTPQQMMIARTQVQV